MAKYGNIGQMNSEWIFILLSYAQKKIKELGGIWNGGIEKLFLISTKHGDETCSIAAVLDTLGVFEYEMWWNANKTLAIAL